MKIIVAQQKHCVIFFLKKYKNYYVLAQKLWNFAKIYFFCKAQYVKIWSMIALIIVSSVLALLIVTFVWWYFGGSIGELKKAKKEFLIPGLDDGFVPQGIVYLSCYKKFLISGYMQDHSLSRVYVINSQTGEVEKFVTFVLPSGVGYFGHAGGIAGNCNDCYLSSEGKIFHFFASDVFASTNGVVKIVDVMETKNGADFCYVSGGYLFVGEFYKLAKFKTDVSHHIKLSDKEINHSLVFGFKLKEGEKFGLASSVPEKAISIPDLVQGMVISGKKIFVSRSYGVARSELLTYENVLLQKTQNYVYFGENQVPLFVLSSKNLQKTRYLPEMAEEIELFDGKLYVVFESASKKYKLFTRTRINYVFSFDLD